MTATLVSALLLLSQPPQRLVERSRQLMGSVVTLRAHTADEPRALAAFESAFDEIARLESLLSVWRDDSDVVRLNAAAGGAPVPVSRDTLATLRAGVRASELTGGKFDVTFGALAGLWRFDHDRDGMLPDMSEVRRRLPLIDYHELVLDDAAGTAQLGKAGMRVHLGGIGKGYAVDRAVALLRAAGLTDFAVQAGGDLYVAGSAGGRRWRVGIRDPRGPPERWFALLPLTDASFSTSGDYERYFFLDGRRYHHIIDPDTGEPARGCRSVTIMAPDALTADTLSTGVFLLGPQRGMGLVETLPDVEAVIVDERNRVIVSAGLRERLQILAAPTDAP